MLDEPVSALCRRDELNGHDGRAVLLVGIVQFPFRCESVHYLVGKFNESCSRAVSFKCE